MLSLFAIFSIFFGCCRALAFTNMNHLPVDARMSKLYEDIAKNDFDIYDTNLDKFRNPYRQWWVGIAGPPGVGKSTLAAVSKQFSLFCQTHDIIIYPFVALIGS